MGKHDDRDRDLVSMTRDRALEELKKLRSTHEALVKKIVELSADVDTHQRDAEHWRIGSGRSHNRKQLLVEIVQYISGVDPATMHPDEDKKEIARSILLRTANKLLLEFGDINNG